MNDRGATHGIGPVTIDVLRNDTDIDDDPLTVTSFDDRGGRVNCGSGACTYTPSENATFTDAFSYTVSDGHGGTASATVLVRVFTDGAPTAENDLADAHGTAGQSIDVLFNDRDPEGDQLLVTPIAPFAVHGQVSCGSTCTYTPDPGFTSSETFGYRIDDGHGGSDTALVTVTVVANGAPVPVNDVGEAHGTGLVHIAVTANDRDPEGDGLSASLARAASYGEVDVCRRHVHVPDTGGPARWAWRLPVHRHVHLPRRRWARRIRDRDRHRHGPRQPQPDRPG